MSQAANHLNLVRMECRVRPPPAGKPQKTVANLTIKVEPDTVYDTVTLTVQQQHFTVWGFTINAGSKLINEVTFILHCTTPGASIHYIEGFGTPTTSDLLYTRPIVKTVPGRYYISARAFKTGLPASAVARASYDLVAL